MSYSQHVLHNFVNMGSLVGSIRNYPKKPMSTGNGPLLTLVLTVAHVGFRVKRFWTYLVSKWVNHWGNWDFYGSYRGYKHTY